MITITLENERQGLLLRRMLELADKRMKDSATCAKSRSLGTWIT